MSFQDYVNSIRGTKNTEAVQSGFSGSFADYVNKVKNDFAVQQTLSPQKILQKGQERFKTVNSQILPLLSIEEEKRKSSTVSSKPKLKTEELTGESLNALRNKAKQSVIAETASGTNLNLVNTPDFLQDNKSIKRNGSISDRTNKKLAQLISDKYDVSDVLRAILSNANINSVDPSLSMVGNLLLNLDSKEIVRNLSQYITDDELNEYYRLYAYGDLSEANKYINDLYANLKSRQAKEKIENAAQYSQDHPLLGSIASVGTNLGSAAEQVGNYYKYLNTGRLDRNEASDLTSGLRQGVSNKTDWMIGNWDVHDFLYNTVMSGVDSAVSGLMLGPTGAGLSLGLSAAASATNDMIERGGNTTQAFFGGVVAGTLEGLFEKMSLGNLKALKGTSQDFFEQILKSGVKGSGRTFVKQLGKDVAKSMGVNASEEAFTEIGNIVYDTLANGNISNYAALVEQYMSENPKMTETEARWRAAGKLGLQVLEAGASGALMGLGFGAVGSTSAYNSAKSNVTAEDAAVAKQTNAISNPLSSYSAEKQSSIRSFISAVDEKLKAFVQSVKDGDLTFKRQKISDVSERAANDIGGLLGIDVSGYTHDINADSVRHILNRHGENGEYNQTMSNDADIARIGWVLENYDTVEVLTKNGRQVYSSGFLDSNGNPAPQIRYIKRIDGTYYVVEAAVENKFKKLWVQSAYLQKTKEDVTQTAAEGNSTNHDADARSASVSPSSNNTVPQSEQTVNNNIPESDGENSLIVDGKTSTGYNNNDEDNFNIGGKTNDEVNTRRHREDRNRQDTSDRERQGTRKDSWTEDKAGFIRRTKETGKSGRQRVIVETEKGGTVFAYTPAEPDNSPAYKAVSYLNDLGIKTVYCDGVMESNDGTVTSTHPEAATGPDGTIYVNKKSSIAPEGVAVHEGTHHYECANSAEYVVLKTVIKSNLDIESRAYVEFVKEIRDKYFANIPIEKLNKDKLKHTVDIELIAYTNQFITTRPDAARIHFAPMFKNWSEVVRATMVFNKAIGLDFVNHGAELQSFETNSKKEINSIFNEPDMSRTAEHIVDFKDPAETQAYRNIIDIAEKLDLELEIGEDNADLNGASEGAKLHMSYGTQTPIRFVMTQALKKFARYSPNFAAFEKAIKETDNLQKWFSNEISNQQDNVLEFAAEALFDDDIGLRKILAVAVSRDKKAAKFVPDFMKEIKKKLADYPGIVEVLDEIQYTFSEAAYDARHERADSSDDVFYDNYSKDESFWKVDNKNKSNSSVTTLKDKLAALFGKKSEDGAAPSISEIVKLIEKTFGIPVSSGKFRHKAYGIYRQKPEAIRTKVANALPTIAHELGHHLDKKHNLSQLPSIEEAIEVLKQQRPDFISSYAPRKHPNEAVAEFVRIYLADRAHAKAMYPKFFSEFEAALSKDGADELNNIRIIGDKINSYFTADKAERARAAILTRAEARKINRRGIKMSNVLETLNIQLLDDGAALKKISDEAYNLYYFAKKSSVRAKNTISGYYMSGFDGDLVEMRDKNGNVIKDKDGKPQYVKSLKYVLEGIDTQEQMSDFDTYLACRHGIYWVENDLRVFADDSLNSKEYMQSEIERIEKQYPNFKETAENLYDWYRTFIYEYGIKSGLLTKEQFKSMTEKYPCYVPFMRNVDKLGGGVKAGAANQSAPIRNAKGSGLEILSPVENIIVKVEQFMKAADRNAIMQEVADVADTAEGKGYLLERVPPSMVPVTVSMKTEPGDIIDDAITETITEFRVSDNQGMNVVRVYRNGEKTYYQVHDKNLLAALTAMNTVKYNIVTRAAGNLTRVFKVLTTGGNAVWSISSNAPRDFSSAYKYSSENNPIKFTVDYIRAIKSAFTEAYLGDKHSDEAIKLYKSMGGGFNNSLSNSARELKLTIKEVLQKDENLVKRITANFNFIEMVEKLADSIETAPRLAEFKRVYEKTGDAKAALSAAEEITVNFNRSGVSGKVVDQFIPYFNASLQGNRKFAKALTESLRSGGDKSFVVKTLLSGVVKVGLIFAINNLIMGDDDNDEYEKLSAYKKNNFYNIYIGDGKFISIPKSKDTAVFDSMLERTFEMAMKEDVEWGKEIEDFLSYLWLVFGPPLLDDTIGFSTALELAKNETFTGAPIVSSYYEDLEPEMQYNEKTTYIARGLGQLFGWSPMKIDHVINSNLGVFGLLNKSVGRPDPDLSLGLMTKFVTDNTYSTDTMNSFYDRAEEYSSLSKSYPDDTDALYNDELYSSVRSIISELNRYGKEDEAAARDYRILANDYAINYLEEIAADGKLIALLERTNNADILPYKTFKADYSIDKVKYRMDSDAFVDYVEEYYSEISQEYRDILRMGYSDETTAAMLIDAKKDVDQYVSKKYKVAQ